MASRSSLDRPLPQQLVTSLELPEELVVQVVAIRDEQQRRVGQLRVGHQLGCAEKHLQGFAAALGVPHNTCPTVAAPDRFQGGVDGFVDCMELVVLGDPLHQPRSLVCVGHEIPNKIEEALLFEYARDQDLQFGAAGRREPGPVNCLPWGEVFELLGERPHACLGPGRDHATGRKRHECGNLGGVGA